MKWIVLVLLMVGFVSAVDVEFDCPNGIFVDEEFECSLEVFDGDGVYDVKVEFDSERDSVLKIWDESSGKWLSGYYYLKEFVEDEADVKLKISEAGRYDGILKLRQGEKRAFFDVGRFVVSPSRILEDGLTSDVVDSEVENEVVVLGDVVEDVVLNERVVYESKDSRVVDKLVYGFALFLIFVVALLLWEK